MDILIEKTGGKPKFEPLELSIIIESEEELNALKNILYLTAGLLDRALNTSTSTLDIPFPINYIVSNKLLCTLFTGLKQY